MTAAVKFPYSGKKAKIPAIPNAGRADDPEYLSQTLHVHLLLRKDWPPSVDEVCGEEAIVLSFSIQQPAWRWQTLPIMREWV
jgi:hypothetical protein